MITYNQLLLNDNDDVFSSLNTNKTLSGIYIYYNNSGLHDIMSSWTFYTPTPVIDIQYNFENTNNIPDNLITTINLEGIIFQKKADNDETPYNFNEMISAMNNLRKIFTDKPYGEMEIKSVIEDQETSLTKIEGLSLQNISFNPTEDNWTKSIKYTISLENSSSLYSGANDIEKYVTDRTYTWNIEPIEDFYNVDSSISLNGRYRTETNNPNIVAINNPNLAIRDFQQFRVTRKISAKGRSGRSLDTPNQISGSGLSQANTRPYIFAKAWVEKMGATFAPSSSNNYSSSPFFASLSNTSSIKTYPFDHKRTVNIDIFEGTYSIDDSWTVLPRPNPYIETYTIESSTDENFIKNVSVQGDIIGLSIYQDPMNIITTGTGVMAKLVGPTGSLITNFDSSIVNSGSGLAYSPLDAIRISSRPSIKRSKYENSLSGWLYDIKPYLYRRASLAINTEDRLLTQPADPSLPPNNPVYFKENFLSVVPISATENHDPFKGSIGYNYTFNNKLNIFGNVISENVSITYENSANSIAEINTLNTNLSSFVQRTSRSNPKKNITVEVSILPATNTDQISMNNPACPMHTGQWLWGKINEFILAHAPYSEKNFPLSPSWRSPVPGRGVPGLNNEGVFAETSDSETWNPTTGKYSRSYNWIYQPHTIKNDHREH